jgi:hypothetical protein
VNHDSVLLVAHLGHPSHRGGVDVSTEIAFREALLASRNSVSC